MSNREKKDGKLIYSEDEIRSEMLEGARQAYEVVSVAYGPKGRNVIIGKDFGRPKLTRDGLSIIRDTYFSDESKNMGAQTLLEAAENANRIAGDGSTCTVALSYHLLKNGVQAIAAGIHPMDIKETYLRDSYKILEHLNKLAKPVAEGQLVQVATVSSGDKNLGTLIANAVERVGVEGGILTEKAPIEDIECEFVDGYYLQTGFQALQSGKKELIDPMVVVAIRRLSSAVDAIEVLNKVAQAKGLNPGEIPRILLVGNVEDAAYFHICNLINQGIIDAVILKTPPIFGDMGKSLLEDIAIYAGCVPITDSIPLKSLDQTYVGSLDKVVSSKTEATLFADNSTEAISYRVQQLKDQIKTEVSDAVLEKLQDRQAKLEGKIALFRIGSQTDGGKEEIEDRVDDAIHATRAAAQHGVVAGGGATLIELSKLDISLYYRDALRDTFKQLLLNANLPAELYLDRMLNAPEGQGFNLRKGGELVDMVKAGVLDPKLVVQEVVKKATEAAANALTIGVGLILETKEEK